MGIRDWDAPGSGGSAQLCLIGPFIGVFANIFGSDDRVRVPDLQGGEEADPL
jgi:hypothetical protein